MLFKLCKTLAMACVALIIAQSSALSFTLEVAGKIDNVTDPVKKKLSVHRQATVGDAAAQHHHLHLLDTAEKV